MAVERGWQLGSLLLFSEAAAEFGQAVDRGGAEAREARLGRAIMLISAQPRTQAKLDEARRLLMAVREESADDNAGVTALFYLARLAQLHEVSPGLAEARTHYLELARLHPSHFFGQLARLKLAMLVLYDVDDASPPGARLQRAGDVGRTITDGAAKRDFHLMMADACLRFGAGAAEALAHLGMAEATGRLARDSTRSSLYVQAGELARTLGRHHEAAGYYRRFLEEFPRDTRAATIRQRLTALNAHTTP